MRVKILKSLVMMLVLLCTFLVTGPVFADHPEHVLDSTTTLLTWDASTATDIAGYKIYRGSTSGVHTELVDVGNVTTYLDEGLTEGEWFYVLTAYDTSNNKSGFSSEVSKVFVLIDKTPPPPPSNLTIAEEIAMGSKHLMKAIVMLSEQDEAKGLRIK